ncbi:unnamed protein product [Ophioblennius macclurei]
MTVIEHSKKIFSAFKDIPAPSIGILTVAFLSCFLFCIQTSLDLPPRLLSIGGSVFLKGHLHILFLYPFYHQTAPQLLVNVATLLFLSSSLEKGVGTVRFMFLFFLLSSIIGLFYSFLDLLQEDSYKAHTEGLVPVTLACVAVTTLHTKTTKGFLCGVSFPTMALPWVFLIITTALVPRSVLPCNVIAILVGWMYGKGWLSFLDLSEARAGVLEKMMPFRWLRNNRVVVFVPANTEERRKTLLPQINPTPGSYPVQAYAPVSNVNTVPTQPMMYEGWTSATYSPTPPVNPHANFSSHSFEYDHRHFSELDFGHISNHSHSHGHGHSHDHGHGHGHSHEHGHGHSHDHGHCHGHS